MPLIALPLLSKWSCLFIAEGRARYLHMIQLYADGSLGARPYASINLDAPLILLNPTHPQSNRTRPSNIAQACDLLPAMECYRLLQLVEEDIIKRDLSKAISPVFYIPSVLDEQYMPTALLALDYGEALSQLRDAAPMVTMTLTP
jgi:hypothetical protein